MYYIGTQQECIDYDLFVTTQENYSEGCNWANPIQNNNNSSEWAILKACPSNGCPRTYESEMTEISELPNGFLQNNNE